ncbi:hypothetical protein C4D60_Mb01t07140 [Musa balbisiana]|uniref:Retrotransposon gag domain-containing protein n=1 Tax=Musa balbisiana TaxID=52838 RepID=A0A4S8JMW7_MUSBA|nr:hypothetical protein C4D60_Mb01t07140 [Musa balbisiana]
MDKVQREFYKSKEKLGESILVGSLFAQEIQDKSIPLNFRLLTLEAYDGGSNLAEHIVTFRAQMALYDTSDAMISDVVQRRPSSVSSFDKLVKELKLYFLASARPKPSVTMLLELRQKEDESLYLSLSPTSLLRSKGFQMPTPLWLCKHS